MHTHKWDSFNIVNLPWLSPSKLYLTVWLYEDKFWENSKYILTRKWLKLNVFTDWMTPHFDQTEQSREQEHHWTFSTCHSHYDYFIDDDILVSSTTQQVFNHVSYIASKIPSSSIAFINLSYRIQKASLGIQRTNHKILDNNSFNLNYVTLSAVWIWIQFPSSLLPSASDIEQETRTPVLNTSIKLTPKLINCRSDVKCRQVAGWVRGGQDGWWEKQQKQHTSAPGADPLDLWCYSSIICHSGSCRDSEGSRKMW